MSDSEDGSIEIPIKETEIFSAILQSVLHTQASVDALAAILIPAVAKDTEHAMRLAQLYEATVKENFKRLASDIHLERFWSDVLEEPIDPEDHDQADGEF